MSTPETKRCSRCHEVRPAADYHRKAEANDGLASYCKPCSAESSRAWRAAHPKPAKPRPALPLSAPKVCPGCGAMFGINHGESRSNYALRITCGRSCGARLAAQAPRSVITAKAGARRLEIRRYLLEHPGVANYRVALALGAHKDTVARVRAELQPPPVRAIAKAMPQPAAPPPQALVPRWDITARHVAEYLQAGERARRLFDPAIAQAAAAMEAARG